MTAIERAEVLDRYLHDALTALGNATRLAEGCNDLSALCIAIEAMTDIKREVRALGEELEDRAYHLMPEKVVNVNGVDWEKSKPPKRAEFARDRFLMDLRDARRATDDGEPIEESDYEKLTRVVRTDMGSIRKTILKEYRLSLDDYSAVSWDGVRGKVAKVADKRSKRRSGK